MLKKKKKSRWFIAPDIESPYKLFSCGIIFSYGSFPEKLFRLAVKFMFHEEGKQRGGGIRIQKQYQYDERPCYGSLSKYLLASKVSPLNDGQDPEEQPRDDPNHPMIQLAIQS